MTSSGGRWKFELEPPSAWREEGGLQLGAAVRDGGERRLGEARAAADVERDEQPAAGAQPLDALVGDGVAIGEVEHLGMAGGA